MKLNRITGPVFAVVAIAALGFGCSARSYDSVLTVAGTAVPPALYQLCQLQSFDRRPNRGQQHPCRGAFSHD